LAAHLIDNAADDSQNLRQIVGFGGLLPRAAPLRLPFAL
jgi:hypothetical protein